MLFIVKENTLVYYRTGSEEKYMVLSSIYLSYVIFVVNIVIILSVSSIIGPNYFHLISLTVVYFCPNVLLYSTLLKNQQKIVSQFQYNHLQNKHCKF